MAQNPNWPLISVLWCPLGHIGYGTSFISYEDMPWLDITQLNLHQWNTGRGRQYETNAMQAGTETTTWDNRSGNFDPSNTGSVYFPNVVPYRSYRRRAQWPTGGVNLSPVDQATSGEGFPWGPGASPSTFGVDLQMNFAEWQVVASATAYQGTQVMEATVEAPSAGLAVFSTRVPVTAGQAYSYTIHMRCLTTGQNPLFYAEILWSTAAGGTAGTPSVGSAATLTGGSSPSWTALTASGTAPAGAVYARIAACNSAIISVNTQIQADGLQWEANASPSTFAAPNPTYNLITGGVERYPQTWSQSGLFGMNTPTITDSFALLANSLLADPLTSAIFTPAGGSAPSFAYLLSDSSSSGTFADKTGNRQAAQITASQAGPGTITSGVAQTATTIPGGLFEGAPGATVVNIVSSTPAGLNAYAQPMSWINLPPGPNGLYGPGLGTGLGYTRMLAFRCTSAPSTTSVLWNAQGIGNVNVVASFLNTSGAFMSEVDDANHGGSGISTGTYDVGNWHLAWLGTNAAGTTNLAGMDGAPGFGAVSGVPMRFAGGFAIDQIGCAASIGSLTVPLFNYWGDVALAVEWPFLLNAAQITAIYNAWRTAFSGDSSGQRYARILGWAGWTGPTAIDTGSSVSLGPATDIVGLDALSALQAVADTEAGNHYVDAAGRLTFKSRAARYNSTLPVAVFGEGPPAGSSGEIPCEDISFDADPTLLANLAQVTQTTTGQILTAQNAGSQTNYGTRTRQIQNQATASQECQDQATYVVSRYQQPTQRVAALKLHPTAIPSMWPTVLALELGARIRVIRRPPSPAPSITTDCFVENIAWTGDDQGEIFLTLQCSPVDATPYAVFAAMHTTLHAQAASGQATAVLNALSDAATNGFSCYVFAGMQMTLDPGGALSETLTVLSVSATSPGYSTVTVTFTTNLANTHAISAVICEALPALSNTTYTNGGASYVPPGPTSPTLWDTASMFGSAAYAY